MFQFFYSFYFLSFQGVLRAFVLIFPRHTDDFNFIKDRLEEQLKKTISTLGAKFGDIGVASPACAGDIVLLGPSTEMQAMTDVVQYNTQDGS
jgi:hypothetical protein